MVPITWYLWLAAFLFTVGLSGVLLKRNALIVMMSVELMLNAANLTFLAFARENGWANGHAIAFFVIAVAISRVGETAMANVGGAFGTVKAVGRVLFTEYLLPFEATSLLLLVAIVGAVVVAKERI